MDFLKDEKEVIDVKTKFRTLAASGGLTLLLLLASPFQIYSPLKAQQNAPQPAGLNITTRNIGGAFELTAETPLYGRVIVHLPDDMAAGDVISGTVVAEPKGNTEEERTKNQDTLNGYVVEMGEQKVPVSKGFFTWTVPQPTTTPPVRHMLRIVEALSGKEVASATIPVLSAPLKATHALGQIRSIPPRTPTPSNFQLPNTGQQGRPVEIFGPFDGNSANTSLKLGDSDALVLAESPRKCVFESPRNLTGPVEITLKEGSNETKGAYRNLGVRLSAPKTELLKGERTTVTVEVSGLEGIKQNVPLRLENRGVTSMDGGNFQNVQIRPTDVQPGGKYITNRTLTGQQAGAFTVTATVIVRPFDICLTDDSSRQTGLLWNTFTGDYIFTSLGPAGQPKPPGGAVQPGGTTQTGGAGQGKPPETGTPPGGVSLTGTGKPTMKGCIITLSHNAPDRRVFAKLDVCNKTGDASVQTSSPKTTFTITDKNTTDNTCAASK